MTQTAEMILTALSLPGVGRKTVMTAAAESKGEPEAFWSCIRHRKALPLSAMDNARRIADEQLTKAERSNVFICTWLDEEYPRRLRDIDDAPVCLFIKGAPEVLEEPSCIAIIGTREPSTFGQNSARSSAKFLAHHGSVIVSGLAKGCDSLAHQGALDAHGKTVAVLAHGVDRVYPAENRGLATEIVNEGGALVSEYFIGQAPTRSSFVERDRIQSALSDAVLVIEAGATSGTMHAARAAVKQQRILAAVEHPETFADQVAKEGNQIILDSMGGIGIQDKAELSRFSESLKVASASWMKMAWPDEESLHNIRNSLIHNPFHEFRTQVIEAFREAMERNFAFAVPDFGVVETARKAAESMMAPHHKVTEKFAKEVLAGLSASIRGDSVKKAAESLLAASGAEKVALDMALSAHMEVNKEAKALSAKIAAQQGLLFEVPRPSKETSKKGVVAKDGKSASTNSKSSKGSTVSKDLRSADSNISKNVSSADSTKKNPRTRGSNPSKKK